MLQKLKPAALIAALIVSAASAGPGLASQTEQDAIDLDNRGENASGEGKFVDEQSYYGQSLAIRQKLYKINDPRVIYSIETLAVACREGKKYKQAEALYNQALARWKSSPQAVASNKVRDVIADNREGLAIVLTESGDLKRAAELYKEVLAQREQKHGPNDPGLAISLRGYADVLNKLHRNAEANTMSERADRIMPSMCGTPAQNDK
ncbi:MAG: tetratricopeptide repeat protein [Cyanobacteria bacterium SZAS LIN-3]|nr:tetratricopeptide repeat protein [Cyanobacteria bacterium SZAS LIN-3]